MCCITQWNSCTNVLITLCKNILFNCFLVKVIKLYFWHVFVGHPVFREPMIEGCPKDEKNKVDVGGKNFHHLRERGPIACMRQKNKMHFELWFYLIQCFYKKNTILKSKLLSANHSYQVSLTRIYGNWTF